MDTIWNVSRNNQLIRKMESVLLTSLQYTSVDMAFYTIVKKNYFKVNFAKCFLVLTFFGTNLRDTLDTRFWLQYLIAHQDRGQRPLAPPLYNIHVHLVTTLYLLLHIIKNVYTGSYVRVKDNVLTSQTIALKPN